MSKEEVRVEVTAETGSLLAGMSGAAASVSAAAHAIESRFEAMSATVERLQAPFVALMGVLAGGAIFKEVVDETRKWNDEAIRLARALGVDTAEASVLAVALDDIYSSTEVYTHAAQMLTRQLNGNGEAFRRLGIETRDAEGHLRPTTELMAEAIDKLNGMEQGTNRNAAGLALFGRGWGEAATLLRLNTRVMEEAREKAEKLGLIVGGDAVAAQVRYKAAMQDAGDVALGLKLAIGSQLLPALSALGEWISSVGVPVITGLAFAVKSIIGFFYELGFVVRNVLQVVVTAAVNLAAPFVMFGRVLERVLHGDSKGAAEAFTGTLEQVRDINTATVEGLGEDWDQLKERLAALWKDPDITGVRMGAGGAGQADAGAEDAAERALQGLKTQLQQQRAEWEAYGLWGKAEEIAFWNSNLDALAAGSKARLGVLQEVAKLEADLAKENRASWEANERELAAVRKARVEGARAAAVEQVSIEEQALAHELAMGRLTATEALGAQQAFLEQKTRIRREALEAQLADERLGAVERAKLNAELDLLEVERRKGLDALEQKAEADRRGEAERRFAPLSQAWSSALQGMLGKTMTFQQGIAGIWAGVGRLVDSVIGEMVTKWASAQLRGYAVFAATKLKELMTNAAVAGSAAAASAAEVPGVGWEIALPAGLAVAGGVASMAAGIASAAGGWERVPQDQVAMVHQNEMILPASIAEPMRQMAAAAQGGAASGRSAGEAGDTYHVTVQALDAASFRDWARANRGTLASVMKSVAQAEGR